MRKKMSVRRTGCAGRVWLRRAVVVILGVAVLASAGCTSLSEWWHNGLKVGPNYKKPPAATAPEWIEAKSSAINTASPNLHEWWTWFEDPVLNHLVQVAYRQNLDVRTAGARVLQARALRNQAIGGIFPQLQEFFAEYKRTGISVNTAQFGGAAGANQAGGIVGSPRGFTRFFDNWSTGFNLAWEIDFWGRFRRAIEAANADFDASIEDYDAVLVLLIADVADAYVQMRTFQQRIEYAEDNIRMQDKLTKQAKDRFDEGAEGSKLDLPQIRSNLTNTIALKEQLELGLRLANNQLCVLLGIPPRDLTKEIGPLEKIPGTPTQLVVGIPAELLRRRPDVRQAERLVAAQSARIGVAVSDLYPHLSIIGTMGWQAEKLSDLISSKSFFGSIAPTLRWDILNYGRLLNNIRVQDALFQQAVLNYQKVVLEAGREAEDGMIGFIKAERRTFNLTESAKDAAEAVRQVELLTEIKKFDINRAFVTMNFLTQQQDQLAQARGDRARAMIQVYRALGGGWQIRLQDFVKGGPCPTPTIGMPLPASSQKPEELPPPEGAPPGGQASKTGYVMPATLGEPAGYTKSSYHPIKSVK
jgi:NodT family efflux transporter outer membrane factor (OMF) lipoprotein